MAQWLIDKFEVAGGFISGVQLQFPPGLTCIIGPRGSGKSTLAEALRCCLFGFGNLPKGRSDLVQANLGSAFLTLQTEADQRGESFTIRRGYKQAASISSSDNREMTEIDLDRGTFLPLDAYSSSEIESIADESLGERRRALLDDLMGDRIREIELALKGRRRDLDANADAIRSAQRLVTDLSEQIEEVGDAKGRLNSLPPLLLNEQSQGVAEATKQQQRNEDELKNLTKASAAITQFSSSITDTISGDFASFDQPLKVEGSANADLFVEVEKLLKTTRTELAHLAQQQIDILDRTSASLERIRKSLVKRQAGQKEEYDKIQQSNLAASQAVQRRSLAEKEVANLLTLEQQRESARNKASSLRNERQELKAQYLQQLEAISQLRSEVAAKLQADAGGRVRLRVIENADQLDYRQTLTDGLRGARVRNHEDILDAVTRFRPDQLAQIIHENDLEEFERHTSFGNERSSKIMAAYRENLDPFELELVSIKDHVRIELDVGSGSDSIFKDAAELSRGQKCTAILPILLARRESPLLIDQPEDNLDNHFIYETVVDSIRRMKEQRQMIFITHNANIPVLGEAELIVVMNSDGKAGFVEKVGSLDECRGQIIDLLEGGEEAFELRRQRYAKR